MARYWQILKWSVIGTLLAIVMLMGSVALGLTWLSQEYTREHPLDLRPYLPQLQTFFAGRGINITADKLELYYDEAPVVRVEALQVLGTDGQLAVFLEQAAVKLANGRLFKLAISPKVIEAKGVTLRLVRGADDVVRIAGLEINTQGAAPSPERGVVDWLDDLPSDRLWGRLKNVRVEGLTLLLRDEPQKAEWVMENGKLSIDRYQGRGERGSLLATVRRIVGPHVTTPKGVRGVNTPILVTLERDASSETRDKVMLEAKFGTLNAAVVGDYLPAQVQDILTGQGTLALGSVLTRGNRLGLPWLTVRLKHAALNLPKEAGYSAPIKLPQLEATISYVPSPTDALQIKSLSFTGPRGNLFVISGTVASPTTNPILNLSAFSPGGDVQAIVDFLPDANPKMAKTRTFLRTKVKDATYRNLVAYSSLRPKAFPQCGDACGGLVIDAEVLKGQVLFLEGIPAAEIFPAKPHTTPARFYWRGQRLAVLAPDAKIAEQSAKSVWVGLDNIFSPSPTMLSVSGSLSGDINSLVGHLNDIPEIKGKIPGTYTGVHTSVLNLSLPMPRMVTPTFASATLTVQGVGKVVSVKGLPVIQDLTITAPQAFISLSPAKILAIHAPEALLEGGKLNLRWQQNIQPKEPTQAAITAVGILPAKLLQEAVGASTISATGALGVVLQASETKPKLWAFTFNANAKGADIKTPRLGYTKPAGEPLTLASTGTFAEDKAAPTLTLARVTLQGHNAAISGTATIPLATDAWFKGKASFPNISLGAHRFNASLGKQTLTLQGTTLDLRTTSLKGNGKPLPNGLNLNARMGTVLFANGTLRNLNLEAATRNGVWDIKTLRGTGAGGVINIHRSGPVLDINIKNLGAILTTTGFYKGLKDGDLFGQLRGSGSTLSGELKLTGFEVRNPPVMLKILGLLSLEQLVAGTDTTKFNSGKIPLSLDKDTVTLNNAHLTGPSMDIRLNGTYARTDGLMNIQGNLAPAIPFNRLVSKVPLLGTLLTGSQDGVVVADFRIKGTTEAPDIHVQPLSILTPGLLKDLFRGGNPTPNTNTR